MSESNQNQAPDWLSSQAKIPIVASTPQRFRAALAAAKVTNFFKSHSIYIRAFILAAGASMVGMPGAHTDQLGLLTSVAEVEDRLAAFMANTDPQSDLALLAHAMDGLAPFLFYQDSIVTNLGLVVDATGRAAPNKALTKWVPEDPNTLVPGHYEWNFPAWTPFHGTNLSPYVGLGTVLAPFISFLNNTTNCASEASTVPVALASFLLTACATLGSSQPGDWYAGAPPGRWSALENVPTKSGRGRVTVKDADICLLCANFSSLQSDVMQASQKASIANAIPLGFGSGSIKALVVNVDNVINSIQGVLDEINQIEALISEIEAAVEVVSAVVVGIEAAVLTLAALL